MENYKKIISSKETQNSEIISLSNERIGDSFYQKKKIF